MTTFTSVKDRVAAINASLTSEAAPLPRLNKGNYGGRQLSATAGVRAESLLSAAGVKTRSPVAKPLAQAQSPISRPAVEAQAALPNTADRQDERNVSSDQGNVMRMAGLFGAARRVSARPAARGAASPQTGETPKPAPRLSLQKRPVPAPRTISLADFEQIQAIRADVAAGRSPQRQKILKGDVDPSIYRDPKTHKLPHMSTDSAVLAMAAAFANPGNDKLTEKAVSAVAEYRRIGRL
ncbi:MAG TPA: hypothetical protein VGN04_09040 [Herbaspirillum sp.]|jgi:hypothetical protein